MDPHGTCHISSQISSETDSCSAETSFNPLEALPQALLVKILSCLPQRRASAFPRVPGRNMATGGLADLIRAAATSKGMWEAARLIPDLHIDMRQVINFSSMEPDWATKKRLVAWWLNHLTNLRGLSLQLGEWDMIPGDFVAWHLRHPIEHICIRGRSKLRMRLESLITACHGCLRSLTMQGARLRASGLEISSYKPLVRLHELSLEDIEISDHQLSAILKLCPVLQTARFVSVQGLRNPDLRSESLRNFVLTSESVPEDGARHLALKFPALCRLKLRWSPADRSVTVTGLPCKMELLSITQSITPRFLSKPCLQLLEVEGPITLSRLAAFVTTMAPLPELHLTQASFDGPVAVRKAFQALKDKANLDFATVRRLRVELRQPPQEGGLDEHNQYLREWGVVLLQLVCLFSDLEVIDISDPSCNHAACTCRGANLEPFIYACLVIQSKHYSVQCRIPWLARRISLQAVQWLCCRGLGCRTLDELRIRDVLPRWRSDADKWPWNKLRNPDGLDSTEEAVVQEELIAGVPHADIEEEATDIPAGEAAEALAEDEEFLALLQEEEDEMEEENEDQEIGEVSADPPEAARWQEDGLFEAGSDGQQQHTHREAERNNSSCDIATDSDEATAARVEVGESHGLEASKATGMTSWGGEAECGERGEVRVQADSGLPERNLAGGGHSFSNVASTAGSGVTAVAAAAAETIVEASRKKSQETDLTLAIGRDRSEDNFKESSGKEGVCHKAEWSHTGSGDWDGRNPIHSM